MAIARITKLLVDSITAGKKDQFIWDSTVKGFGLKVTPSGSKVFIVQYRDPKLRGSRPTRVTIGKFGSPWTADNARAEAKRILGMVATGNDPTKLKASNKTALTVAELCDIYFERGASMKKASTIATDRGRVERHIKPLLGKLKVSQVTKHEVREFINDVAAGKTARDVRTGLRGRVIVTGGKGTATRTAGLLSGIFAFAVDAGYLDTNPVHGVAKFKGKKNERFLSLSEIQTIGGVLSEMEGEGVNPKALSIIRLLALTGARRGEIVNLKRSEVDLDSRTLRLADSKTGQKNIPLNRAAIEILSRIIAEDQPKRSAYLFPAEAGDGPYNGVPKVWQAVRNRIGDPTLRLHDLRHSFASLAVSQGASLPMIGALLGHANSATTQRYAHLSDDPVRGATEMVGDAISAAWKE
jgi:integrase